MAAIVAVPRSSSDLTSRAPVAGPARSCMEIMRGPREGLSASRSKPMPILMRKCMCRSRSPIHLRCAGKRAGIKHIPDRIRADGKVLGCAADNEELHCPRAKDASMQAHGDRADRGRVQPHRFPAGCRAGQRCGIAGRGCGHSTVIWTLVLCARAPEFAVTVMEKLRGV